MLDVIKLVEQSHGQALRSGWWDEARAEPPERQWLDPHKVDAVVETKLVLIAGELVGEAFEEVRRLAPDQLKLVLYECKKYEIGRHDPTDSSDHAHLEQDKPVGFLVELADAAIRICDLAGAMRVGEAVAAQYEAVHEIYAEQQDDGGRSRIIAGQLRKIERSLSLAWPVYEEEQDAPEIIYDGLASELGTALAEIEALAVLTGASALEFERAIGIKMQFNARREYRHGGLRA